MSGGGGAPSVRRLLVSGRVQGVGYRRATVRAASALGVTGWVRNLADGRVEILVQGSDDAVARLIAWARQGPPAASVEGVLVEEGAVGVAPAAGFSEYPTADFPEPL